MNPGTSVDCSPLRVGDRMIHLDNNDKKQVFNGEIGSITEVSETERVLQVVYPERQVCDAETEWDGRALAYCMTVRQAQGSDFPCTVVVMHWSHYPTRTGDLRHTAVTRRRSIWSTSDVRPFTRD